MKRFSILSLICLAAFTLQSCLFSEDDIFEDSSTNRTNQALDNYQALLTSATNGWKLEYYPGGKSHDIGGDDAHEIVRRRRDYHVRHQGTRFQR